MTRVGNVDQVLLLLREQLQRVRRGGGAKSGLARAGAARPLDRARALAMLDSLDENEVRRAVVRGALVEEFGEGVGNDPAFQDTVDRVACIIEETPEGAALIGRAIAQLKDTAA